MRKATLFSILVLFFTSACAAAIDGDAVSFPQVGSQAPEFSAQSVAGKAVSISDLRGQVVLVGVPHLVDVVDPLLIETQQQRREPERVAAAQLA